MVKYLLKSLNSNRLLGASMVAIAVNFLVSFPLHIAPIALASIILFTLSIKNTGEENGF
jgi:hypothetical protein